MDREKNRKLVRSLSRKRRVFQEDVKQKVFKGNQRKFDYQKKASPSTYSGLDLDEEQKLKKAQKSLSLSRRLDVLRAKAKHKKKDK